MMMCTVIVGNHVPDGSDLSWVCTDDVTLMNAAQLMMRWGWCRDQDIDNCCNEHGNYT